MTKLSKTWWDRLLFRANQLVPTRRLIQLYMFLIIPIAIMTLIKANWLSFIIINLFVLLASLLDYFRLPRANQVYCERELFIELERGEASNITLQLTNQSKQPIWFQLIDHLPNTFDRPFPIEGKLAGKATLNLSYTTTVAVRGDYSLDKTSLRIRSALGLWQKQLMFSSTTNIKVIPNMTTVHEVLGSLQSVLSGDGSRIKKNKLGAGEFAQVRAYAVGDDPRKMNWRQSAKHMELMTNVYEPEHGKQLILLLDCGRTMGVELTKTSRLERSVEALLTVAAGALSQGDYVSVLAFSSRIKAYVPPGKGIEHFRTIVEEIYHLQSDDLETNFTSAVSFLNSGQRKRSLLMLFSDLDSFLYDDAIWSSVGLLKKRHFLLILSISDPVLKEVVEKSPVTPELAFLISAAERQLLKRRDAINKWSHLRQTVIEVPEEEFAAAALSRYIDVARRDIV